MQPTPEQPTESVMDVIVRAGQSRTSMGDNPDRPKVLEVHQVWSNVLLDTRHFSRLEGDSVTAGTTVGWKWHFLGIDLGWVDGVWRHVLPYAPPMWSEVSSEWRDDFYLPDDVAPADAELFVFDDGEYAAVVRDGWTVLADLDGVRHTLSDLIDKGLAYRGAHGVQIPMREGLRLILMTGPEGVVFVSQLVPEGARIVQRAAVNADPGFMMSLGLLGFLGAMFALVMATAPPPAEHDVFQVDERVTALIYVPPEKKKKVAPEPKPEGEGAKAKKKEGERKHKTKRKTKDKRAAEAERRAKDKEIAENSGILSALQDPTMSALADSSLTDGLVKNVQGLIGVKGGPPGSGLGSGAAGSVGAAPPKASMDWAPKA